MNIVVLDGYAANPGDLCWDELQALGECTIYDRTAPAEVLERAAGAEILLTNKTVLTAEHMAALPELKYIGVLATGYNIVDTAAAKERGIIVTNIPAYSTDSGAGTRSPRLIASERSCVTRMAVFCSFLIICPMSSPTVSRV